MNYYSRETIDPNFFAPAVIQRFALVMMMLRKIVDVVLLLQITIEFLSFHKVHDTSMVSKAMAFLVVVPARV